MNKIKKLDKPILEKNSRNPDLQNQDEENFDMYIPIKKALDKVVENIYEYYKNDFGNTEKYLETGFKKFFLRKGDLIIIDSFKYLEEIINADKDELPYIQKKLLEKYKDLSEQYNIPIIILMDLSGNDDREPSITDFKKNMIIPRTVDQVLLLQQERILESLIE